MYTVKLPSGAEVQCGTAEEVVQVVQRYEAANPPLPLSERAKGERLVEG